jgi:hypothetical protein
MAKSYGLQFGSGNPASKTGLSPTFTTFADWATGSSTAAPGVTEIPAGSGLYRFIYGPTNTIIFVADGGPSLASDDRYIVGSLDPIQVVDERLGTVGDSFGSTATDPSTAIGYLKRALEWLEGNAVFTKATGAWDVYSRGSSSLLRTKTLSNNTSLAEKD